MEVVTKKRIVSGLLSHCYELCTKLCKLRLRSRIILKANVSLRIVEQHAIARFYHLMYMLFCPSLSFVLSSRNAFFFRFICLCFALMEFYLVFVNLLESFAFLVYAVNVQLFVHIIKYYLA